MNNSELMKALLELATSLIQKAKEKGFDILLLLGVVVGLIFYIHRTESAFDSSKMDFKGEIASLMKELQDCNASRGRLEVKVAVMEVQLKALEKVFKGRSAQR